ncbi:MAG: NAD-dependent dehydratase [Patescibacteria group bacterium]|nr:MAG: NAD-dependent dehydratase [Patescibacteria group bacterium]
MKTVFVAGAGGYIGTEMVEDFLKRGYYIVALDRFFFGSTLQDLSKNKRLKIIKGDIRFLNTELLKGVDVVINLASISNDPSAALNPKITKSINDFGAVKLARVAKEAGVKRYIFASSCSVYGAGQGTLSEQSPTSPLSEYAKSKISAEKKLLLLADNNFIVTIPRISTVFGVSKRRMRFDLLINIMTLHAWKNNKIFIMGGGRQWRPLIHISDVIEAFHRIMVEEDIKKINKQIFNVGSNEQNYQVRQIATKIKSHFQDLIIEETPDDPDQRSYKVSFDKIKQTLAFHPKVSVDEGILEVKEALEKGEITEDIKTNTMWYYRYLLEADSILSSVKIRNRLF